MNGQPNTFFSSAGMWAARHRNILMLAALFLLMNLVGLDRSGVVWVDEVTVNDPAKELALHGTLRSSVFSGYDGFDQVYLWLPPGQPLVTAAVYRLFGFGIWQTRVPVVLFAAGALFLLYGIASYFLNSGRIALFCAALFALNPQFIHAARSGRMDAECLFFAFAGLLLYLRSSHRTRYFLALAGLCIGLSGLTHPLGIVWALAIAASILIAEGERKLARLAWFCASAALPVAAWLLYALRTPELFERQFLSILLAHTAGGSLLRRIAGEAGRYVIVYRTAPLLLAALVAGTGWFLFRYEGGSVRKTQLLLLAGIPFLFVTLFMTKEGGSWFYILHPVAMMTIFIGTLAASFLPVPGVRARSTGGTVSVVAAFLLLGNLAAAGIGARYLALAAQWNERDYATIEEPIREMVPPGSVIFGAPEVWYAAVRTGSSLRLRGEPDARMHDFVVTKAADSVAALPGFRKIGEIGEPFPPVLGRFAASKADYRMVLWEATRRNHDFLEYAQLRP